MKTRNSLNIFPWIGNLKVDYFFKYSHFQAIHHILEVRIKTKFALRVSNLTFQIFYRGGFLDPPLPNGSTTGNPSSSPTLIILTSSSRYAW